MSSIDQSRCSFDGCETEWDVMCIHGHWCWRHSRTHRNGENECDREISRAITLWMTTGAIPFIKAIEHLQAARRVQDVQVAQIDENLFPVRLAQFDAFKKVMEILDGVMNTPEIEQWLRDIDHTAVILKEKLADITQEIREKFEGDEMPFNLDDAEVWTWYRSHLETKSPEH